MKSKYAMTEAQVENLARDIATAQDVTNGGRTTYLRVLVTHMQATLGKVKRGRPLAVQAQLEVLDTVSGRLYPAVLRGITTHDLEPAPGLDQVELTRRSIERNRRSTFARSAKSTLGNWIKAGGDMRTLDPDTVTRDPLAAQAREARGVNGAAYTIDRHRSALYRLIEKEAEADPDAARADIESTMDALQAILDSLSPNGNAAKPAAPTSRPGPTISQVLRSRPAHTRQPAPSGRAHA
jgi:hypothetical protein